MKKLLALTLVAVLALSMAACGGNKEPETPADTTAAAEIETEAVTEAVEVTAAEETAEAVEETETAAAATDTAAETEAAPADETTEAAEENKTPQTKEEIVEFYKKAATETNKGKINAKDQMTLVSLDGGSGAVGNLVSLFEPIAKSALEKNSGSIDHVTGGFENLTADDVASATAKSDGKYTTVRINLKEQTDGMYGKSKEGHVGHGVSILDGVQKAIDELNGVTVDTSEGDIKLHYNNAYIDCKIDNETGKIVSGKWHYTVNVSINNIKAKIGIVPATLHDAKGVVEYAVTL